MYTNVPMKRVVSMHDVESIYTIPESLRESGLDREVLTLLDLHDRTHQRLEDQNRQKWSWFVSASARRRRRSPSPSPEIRDLRDAYASIMKACEHCGVSQGVNVNLKWVDTTAIEPSNVTRHLRDCHGIIVPGGFGIRGTEGKIECIRYAREQKVPYLGSV
jgi:CTP synthase